MFANDANLLATLATVSEFFVPAIVVGELFYGARHSTQVDDNMQQIIAFCDSVTILPCDQGTADQYGRLKNELRTQGRPIPENDVWIAAIACQHELPLLSRDEHFDHIPGIIRNDW